MLSSPVEDGGLRKQRCNLCPHFCILLKGESGRCHVRENTGDEIALYHPGLSIMAVDTLARKPLLHVPPDPSIPPKTLEHEKTLSIGSTGCSLSCQFCENHDISQVRKQSRSLVYFPDQLVFMAYRHRCASITMSFNEPTIAFEDVIRLSEECHKEGIRLYLKTNAFVNKEPWEHICKAVDAINIDWKGSEKEYFDICGASKYVVEDRIKEAYELGVHIEISILIYAKTPRIDAKANYHYMAKFIASLDPHIPVHLIRIISPGQTLAGSFLRNASATPADVEVARSIFRNSLAHVH